MQTHKLITTAFIDMPRTETYILNGINFGNLALHESKEAQLHVDDMGQIHGKNLGHEVRSCRI